MESSAAACSVYPTAHASPYSAVFHFLSHDLDLWPLTFELEQDFCTVHLTAKFHHSTFNSLEVIMLTNKQTDKLTNKQTPLKTSTLLLHAMPVDNYDGHAATTNHTSLLHKKSALQLKTTGIQHCFTLNKYRVSELQFNVPFQHKHGYIRDENKYRILLTVLIDTAD